MIAALDLDEGLAALAARGITLPAGAGGSLPLSGAARQMEPDAQPDGNP